LVSNQYTHEKDLKQKKINICFGLDNSFSNFLEKDFKAKGRFSFKRGTESGAITNLPPIRNVSPIDLVGAKLHLFV
jgi:hypothetical protein